MIDPKDIRRGALLELHDSEQRIWIPVDVRSIVLDHVELRTLANEPILTTMTEVFRTCRVRPNNGACADCGGDAHEGSCVERLCTECGAEVSSRCSLHPRAAVNVYKRDRYLAEVQGDKPYPTRDSAEDLRRDLTTQMRVLRNAEQPRQDRIMITGVQRAEILSALETAIALIASLPGKDRR